MAKRTQKRQADPEPAAQYDRKAVEWLRSTAQNLELQADMVLRGVDAPARLASDVDEMKEAIEGYEAGAPPVDLHGWHFGSQTGMWALTTAEGSVFLTRREDGGVRLVVRQKGGPEGVHLTPEQYGLMARLDAYGYPLGRGSSVLARNDVAVAFAAALERAMPERCRAMVGRGPTPGMLRAVLVSSRGQAVPVDVEEAFAAGDPDAAARAAFGEVNGREIGRADVPVVRSRGAGSS